MTIHRPLSDDDNHNGHSLGKPGQAKKLLLHIRSIALGVVMLKMNIDSDMADTS